MILPAGRIPNAERESLARSPLLATRSITFKSSSIALCSTCRQYWQSAGLAWFATRIHLLVVRHGVTIMHHLELSPATPRRPIIGVVLNRFKLASRSVGAFLRVLTALTRYTGGRA